MINTVNIDKLSQTLGELYKNYGYKRYKMSKFEEYDTYVSNKDFLVSDRVITFTDVSGKLLAMKPDVTISIIKNTDDKDNLCHKLYYNENVYRVSKGTHAFAELMQIGLECLGNIDFYNVLEVIALAGKSLEAISEDYVLDISHMGLVNSVIEECSFTDAEAKKVLLYISEKNMPQLIALCEEKELTDELTKKLTGLIDIYGSAAEVLDKLSLICTGDESKKALNELKMVCDIYAAMSSSDKLKIDFSVINDMNYYNGLVFQGYIEGIPTHVLSGGQYDKLMSKMGKSTNALGFAIYLDLLEYLDSGKNEYDADVVIVYNDNDSCDKIFKTVAGFVKNGSKAVALKKIPKGFTYREKIQLDDGGDLK